jgi:hypothetical protein
MYAFFRENKLVDINVWDGDEFYNGDSAWFSIERLQKEPLEVYLASDIKSPTWETRPDGLQQINYENS